MKNFKVLKRIFAVFLAAMMVVFAAGCGETDTPTISDLQEKAKKVSKSEAEKTYKNIVNLINERADLIPEFMEEEKDHTKLKLDEYAYNDVLTAREAVKTAKTKEEMAEACVQLDEAIFGWMMAISSLNPKTEDPCYLALYAKMSDTSKRLSSLINNYNNLVETYNKSVSKDKAMEKFVLPASDLIESAEDEK
jgi:hypothetical protein